MHNQKSLQTTDTEVFSIVLHYRNKEIKKKKALVAKNIKTILNYRPRCPIYVKSQRTLIIIFVVI